MQITIIKWELRPISSLDVCIVAFDLEIGALPGQIKTKTALVGLSGSMMTQIGGYISAMYGSGEFDRQYVLFATGLLTWQLQQNPELIHGAEIRLVYSSDTFPLDRIELPEISTPIGWSFMV